jgi:hypothetical protein
VLPDRAGFGKSSVRLAFEGGDVVKLELSAAP